MVSPVSWENGDTRSLDGEVSPVRVGKLKVSNERLSTGKPMTSRTLQLGNSGTVEEHPREKSEDLGEWAFITAEAVTVRASER